MKYKITLAIAVIRLSVWASVPFAKAMQSYFVVNSSATATTTTSFLSPGAGTTTYQLGGGFNNLMAGVDKSNVFVQVTASSSATVLNWTYQYSNNSYDWYTYASPLSQVAGA